jgi:hypothetical protein
MFYIQEPGSVGVISHLEQSANNADYGLAAFAFASEAGVRFLFQQPNILRLARECSLRLLVGTDAITNVVTIELLSDLQEDLPGLEVNAFVHQRSGAIFHPKFSIFRSDASATLVVGSGNLTLNGLGQIDERAAARGNWEAFSVEDVSSEAGELITAQWEQWCTDQHSNGLILGLSDPQVLSAAMENSRLHAIPRGSRRRDNSPQAGPSPVSNDQVVQFTPPSFPVLISEIPSGSNRWGQANFHLDNYRAFFGFEEDAEEPVRMVIQHVEADGELGEPEARQTVSVQSRNFRVELGAARGRRYAATANNDRPVVVFVKLASHAYRYRLMLPTDHGYQGLLRILGPRPPGRAFMRQTITDTQNLRESWNEAPASLFPIFSDLPEV